MKPRVAITLLELLVALALGGLVLGIVGSLCVRQQRIYADLALNAARSEQLRDAASILPIDLRGISAVAGDVRDARDTALEFRATIASAVVCDSSSGAIVLAPASTGPSAFTSIQSPIASGDTAWVLAPTDSTPSWNAYRITATSTTAAGACATGAPRLTGAALTARRQTLTLSPTPPSPIGTVVRVTRPFRYSLYRAADNLWYLGARDWNSVSQQFNTIQPVSGPFLSAALHGIVFTYLDATGAALPTPVVDTRAIRAVRADLRAQTSAPIRVLTAAGPVAPRVDSTGLLIVFHDRQ